MNITEFRSYVRSLLAEPEASYWTDDEIDSYLSVAMTNVMGRVWTFLFPIYSVETTLDIEAGNPYVSLPSDFSRAIYIKLAKDTSLPFPYIQDNLLDYYVENNLSGWRFEGGKIRIYPTPSESVADGLVLKYLPKWKSLEDVPEELHPLLAVEVVIQAKVKDENIPNHLILLQKQFYDDAVRGLVLKQLQNPEIAE